MTREELMIGDWVLKDMNFLEDDPMYTRTDYQPYQIMTGEDIDLACETNWLGDDVYQPIPLTPEILEKNGFDVSDKEVMQYHFEEDGEKYHFSLRQMYDKDGKPHGYSFYAFNVLTLLDYVHELQHALKLCGIDNVITV